MEIVLRSATKSKSRNDVDWSQIEKLLKKRVLENKSDIHTVDLLAKNLFSDDKNEQELSLDLLMLIGNFRGFDAVVLRAKKLDDFSGYCIIKICWEEEYLKQFSEGKEEELAGILVAAAGGLNPVCRKFALRGMEYWNPVHIMALESKKYQ